MMDKLLKKNIGHGGNWYKNGEGRKRSNVGSRYHES